MLIKRLIVVAILLPLAMSAIYIGGWYFYLLVTFLLVMAAWEYGRLFRSGGYAPLEPLIIGGVGALALSRSFTGFEFNDLLLAILFILSMTWHTLAYQRGAQRSASDFAIDLGGVVYLGFIGAYLISLRSLEDGQWWMMLVILAVIAADSCAFFVGRAFGRHKMAPRVSPGKSWEGYAGGVAFSMITTSLFGALFHRYAPQITWQAGLIYGAVLSTLAPFGDLGESMLKRQFGVKDSSRLLSEHGGFLDRLDSLLWAGVIGYFLTRLFIAA